jgi:hypothetical protein
MANSIKEITYTEILRSSKGRNLLIKIPPENPSIGQTTKDPEQSAWILIITSFLITGYIVLSSLLKLQWQQKSNGNNRRTESTSKTTRTGSLGFL